MIVETAFKTAAEFAATLGLEAGKNRFKEKVDEKKLKDALSDYIECQRKYYEICTLAEEIDFQALVEYINQNLLSDVDTRFFSVNRKDRSQAHKSIVDAAVAYSKAKYPKAEVRVDRLISTCLEIIRNFYKKGTSKKDYLIAAEIVDAVVEPLSTQMQNMNNELSRKLDNLGGSMYSLGQFANDAQSGDFRAVDKRLKTIFQNINPEHPLFPDYGFAYENGLKSVPLTNDAAIKYPSKYRFTGRVHVGDMFFSDPTIDPFDYAYRHQLVLTMDVSEAKKYLGEIEDPAGFDTEHVVEVRAYPPEFPSAFPCEVKVKDKTFFDNVMMRTKEIEDDGTYVFGNHEQLDVPFKFEVRVNFIDGGKLRLNEDNKPAKIAKQTDFKVHIQDADNREYLNFVNFLKALSDERDLRIIIKEVGELIVAGMINNVNYPTGFESIDEEIDFLERICDIEEYFGVQFNLTGEIDTETYNAVMQISELSRNDEVSHTWTGVNFTGTVNETFRNEFMKSGKEMSMISYVGTMHANFLGAEFEFQYMRTFKNAVVKDYDRIQNLVSLLNDGDPIKVEMVPGKDKTAIDTLRIPDNIE